MPFNCYAETSLAEMCGLWMQIFWHPYPQKCSLHYQLSNDRHP